MIRQFASGVIIGSEYAASDEIGVFHPLAM
jgi:hypothetical protein